MKLRLLIFICTLASWLFIFSKDPPDQEIKSSISVSPEHLDEILDSLNEKISFYKKQKSYKDLYALEPIFAAGFDRAPDSIRMKFRSTCMTYAFQMERRLGDYRSALKYYLLAHQYVDDPVCLDTLSWFIENVISNIYTRFGDYEKSDYYAGLVEKSMKCHGYYTYLSRLYTNIGTTQKSRGRHMEAMDYFVRGLHIADSLQYDLGIFANCLNLADFFTELHQDSLAQVYLDRAAQSLARLQSDNRYFEKKSGWESTAGKIYGNQKNFSLSIQYYQASIETLKQRYLTQKHREFAKLYADLADIFLESGKPDSGQWSINQGLLSLVPDYPESIENLDTTLIYRENSFIDLLYVQYELFDHRYKQSMDTAYLIRALRCVRLGLYANDLLYKHLSAEDSKLKSILSNKRLTNYGIEALYTLYAMNPSSNYLRQARGLFTRSKSILYNEKIKHQAFAKQFTKEDQAIRDTIESAMLDLYDQKYEPGADFRDINSQLLKRQEALNLINTKYEKVQIQVLRHEHYIEYAQTDKNIYAFSKIKGKENFVQLGFAESFKALIGRMNQYITLKELSLDTSIRYELFHFLVEPIDPFLPQKLVIIPDGQIGLVPFEMLENKQKELVLEQTTISYEYQFEPYVLKDKHTAKPDLIFCLIPRYHLPAPMAIEASRGSLYDLPFAREEVDTIQQILGKDAVVSEEGDKAEILSKLKKAKIFHFSGHSIIQSDLAFLALTDKPGMEYQLTDQEIGFLSLPLEMVVLSACETGLGKWEYGEGIRSLGRSFMEAGAGAAVYSLWSVNDRSTAKIMSSFYSFLKKGYPKDEALRRAKMNFLSDARVANKHPYHWAAFIATGDMDPLAKDNLPWLLMAGLVAVLIIALKKVLDRRR